MSIGFVYSSLNLELAAIITHAILDPHCSFFLVGITKTKLLWCNPKNKLEISSLLLSWSSQVFFILVQLFDKCWEISKLSASNGYAVCFYI